MNSDKKILIVDDEAAIRKFLRLSLECDAFNVIEAANAKDGIRELIGRRPEAVILDLGLPDMDGIEAIHLIREWSSTPIIVLTVKDDEDSKVRALDAGADDYLTKPFSVPELMARLRAALRRTTTDSEQQSTFKSGGLEVDLAGRIVKISGVEIHLTNTEYDILALFIKHAGKVLTHRQILKEIWGPNAVEHTQYLRVYIGHLRKKIEPPSCSQQIIITEPGVGYRLVAISSDKQ